MKEKVIVSWSGGKDSALALCEIQRDEKYEIAALLTTINQEYDRVSIHGVRRILLEQQAQSLGLPLEKVFIPKKCSDEEYESKMRRILEKYLAAGTSAVVFGDIYLEDLKKYRQENLSKIGMKAVFPIWKRDTAELAHKFIDSSFRAVITCVDLEMLDKKFAGSDYNRDFLAQLPADIDPCGENGEFHSFVYDGPIFKERIPCSIGEVVLRENRFYFCDLTLISGLCKYAGCNDGASENCPPNSLCHPSR